MNYLPIWKIFRPVMLKYFYDSIPCGHTIIFWTRDGLFSLHLVLWSRRNPCKDYRLVSEYWWRKGTFSMLHDTLGLQQLELFHNFWCMYDVCYQITAIMLIFCYSRKENIINSKTTKKLTRHFILVFCQFLILFHLYQSLDEDDIHRHGDRQFHK